MPDRSSPDQPTNCRHPRATSIAATTTTTITITIIRATDGNGQVSDVIADPGDLWQTSCTHGALIMCASRNELANILYDRELTPLFDLAALRSPIYYTAYLLEAYRRTRGFKMHARYYSLTRTIDLS